jgi:hypothetical protein
VRVAPYESHGNFVHQWSVVSEADLWETAADLDVRLEGKEQCDRGGRESSCYVQYLEARKLGVYKAQAYILPVRRRACE